MVKTVEVKWPKDISRFGIQFHTGITLSAGKRPTDAPEETPEPSVTVAKGKDERRRELVRTLRAAAVGAGVSAATLLTVGIIAKCRHRRGNTPD